MKRTAFALIFSTIAPLAFALDNGSTGGDWANATAADRDAWTQRMAEAAKGDVALAAATVQCIDEATHGENALKGQKLVELSALCMTMLQSQRDKNKK